MKTLSPLLSVIIPTKNRYIYLQQILPILLSIRSDDIEIVVQDNTVDNHGFLSFLQALNDPRVSYFHQTRNISQTENSNEALINSKGRYVCFIGDDDVILPNIMDMIAMMEREGIECLIQNPVTYFWADVTFKYKNNSQLPASFIIDDVVEEKITSIDAMKELRRIAELGGTQIGLLPKIYHGIVSRSLLDKVFSKCGSYFPGPSPDMASSTALSHFISKLAFSHMPFTISGKSGLSASGMGLAHSHKGNLAGLKFLPENTVETWDPKIPKFWSCSTIWAQSLYTSLKACGSKLQINYKALYANLLVFEPHYRSETLDIIKNASKAQRLSYYSWLALNYTTTFFKRGINFLKRKIRADKNMVTYKNVQTIAECYEKVASLLPAINANTRATN